MDFVPEGHYVHLVVFDLIWCNMRRLRALGCPLRNRLELIITEAAENGWQIIRLAIQLAYIHLRRCAHSSMLPTDIPA
jgi:hypothetical protein